MSRRASLGVRRAPREPVEPTVPLLWVDAFAEGQLRGNPAAVCLLERPAPPEAMQALASELGLSESAFVWPDGAAFSLRWFTPVTEVDLCGHATVAAAHALAETGRCRDHKVRFATRSGTLEATIRGEVTIDLPAESPVRVEPPRQLAARWPVVGAAEGRFDLLVELADAEAVRRADPRSVDLLALPYRGVAVTARGERARGGADADYVLRFFAPRVGVAEDPVTGSAQCLLGPYWSAELGRAQLRAVQLSARGGVLRVAVGSERVAVGGRAETVLSGQVQGVTARCLLGA